MNYNKYCDIAPIIPSQYSWWLGIMGVVVQQHLRTPKLECSLLELESLEVLLLPNPLGLPEQIAIPCVAGIKSYIP